MTFYEEMKEKYGEDNPVVALIGLLDLEFDPYSMERLKEWAEYCNDTVMECEDCYGKGCEECNGTGYVKCD